MMIEAVFAALAFAEPPKPCGPEGWKFREELATDRSAATLKTPTGTPWLENRISRCFFSPIKRPPFYRDELADNIDYYPDAYLERLSKEGVNGLWLSTSFADLTEGTRLEKLKKTVDKCAKYGIKIWIFCIEPRNRDEDCEFFKQHPEAKGPKSWDYRPVNCASAKAVHEYLESMTEKIFKAVPKAAGIINIANGERPTTCLSFADALIDKPEIPCPVCSKRQPWELYADIASAMVRGMRKGNPNARLITWFYQPQTAVERGEWVSECARHVPEGVTLQCNFESGAVREQEGKTRIGGDYWLSFPGPAEQFRKISEAARGAGNHLAAKIQTSCSHECATVPYVPVPGLLYRKFKGMKECGVKDVMMCWYFGNAPGLMNRAAGRLAYEDFTEGEDAFLKKLAAEEWGEDAETMGKLWRQFSDGYSNYPLSKQMQYYGPFHTAFALPLYPEIEMRSLQRTWQPMETPGGDLQGEALAGFTLEDAYGCAKKMFAAVQDVRPELKRLYKKYAANRERRRDIAIMMTLANLFEGSRDIFKFYLLRREAIFASRAGDIAKAVKNVAEMKAILARQREITKEMIPLCEDDSRLGFHSEAEAHQFDAAYLRWRLGTLEVSEAALDKIAAELAAGRPYPRSERETTGEFLEGVEQANGDIVVEGKCAKGKVTADVYDLCGTCERRTFTAEERDGAYRLVIPADSWKAQPELKPAWIVVRQGSNFNNGGTTWAFPNRPMFKEPRLNQEMLTGDNFARLVLRK